MKYRKYVSRITLTLTTIIAAVTFSACATVDDRGPASVNEEESSPNRSRLEGSEPRSMRGDIGWLNEVEDRYKQISAENNASRTIASTGKSEFLLKQKNWTFSYQAKTNQFFIGVKGQNYKLVQTRLNDGERFAFAADGATDKPVTFSVAAVSGRTVASETVCDTEVSYWNKQTGAYVTDRVAVKGKACRNLITKLKDYVP